MRSVLATCAILLLCLGFTGSTESQQSPACPAFVQTALSSAEASCAALGRNQACYGNGQLELSLYPDAGDAEFDSPGDLIDASWIESLRLSPMDVDRGHWGVSLLRLQANLPDTLPGQNVTFILFGDVEIENRAPAEGSSYGPMQAFYLRTGIGEAACAEAPRDGLLIQTPHGARRVQLQINGVDVELGSTAFIQATDRVRVSTLQGYARVEALGGRKFVYPGTAVSVPLDEELSEPAAPPGDLEPYEEAYLEELPYELLEEEIEVYPALTEEEILELEERIEAGEFICGDPPLDPCEDFEDFEGDWEDWDGFDDEFDDGWGDDAAFDDSEDFYEDGEWIDDDNETWGDEGDWTEEGSED